MTVPTFGPIARAAVLALGLVSAISAIAGGLGLITSPLGDPNLPPIHLLAHTPFESFLVPGLILAVVVGGTSLGATMLAWRRSRAAVDATILAGGALTVWILAEIGMIRAFHWLHGLCGALGLGLLTLGVQAAWRSRLPRHRWVISVTLAETIGYLAPACAGILSVKVGLTQTTQSALVVTAGLVEGIALGTGQALAFPFSVRRLRYVLLTALGAGTVWLLVMSTRLLLGSHTIPVALGVAAAFVAGLIGLPAIGFLQWIELRHHASSAHRWIGWTALAWAIALPLSFTPGPFVDESTPIAAHFALWGSAGALMAYVMAGITWQGVRRLSASRHSV